MKKKIFTYIFLFINIITFSQYSKYDKISDDVWILHIKHTDSYNEYYENGKLMLALSKNDKDRSLSYLHMGDAQIKNLNYSSAIELLKKGNLYSEKSNFYKVGASINYLLSDAYKKVGLQEKADESWDTALKIAYNTKDPDYENMLLFGQAVKFEEKSDYCKAIPFREKLIKLIEYQNKKLEKITFREYIDLSIKYDYLTFDYLKCDQFKNAKIAFNTAEELLKTTHEENHHKISFHYMCKAIILVKENDLTAAKFWFEKARESALKRKETDLLKIISQEALLHNIHVSENAQTYIEINDKNQNETKKAIKSEIILKKEQTDKKIELISIASFVILSLVLLGVRFYNKKQKKHFEKIIAHLEKKNKKNNEIVTLEEIDETKSKDVKKSGKKIMPSEKEKELLQRLIIFEEGIEYTSKNFTFSNFISALDTNSKYGNYIIKQYRGKNFNDYINGLRIEFIVEKLYNEPEYLNYKISYLADISGFSTHSRFTQIFKNITEISPSKFIQELQNKHKKK
ncbi:hypothetical protein BAS09_18290 [Elizabethkingia ursingii]|uniref:helix-turn-helix domain-containing protein n=1 Tax=Elizabethkingia ursingii TaxID=1756150 RepID=UPI00099966C0|nr:helix-turn-helix domain-containing protein [Elizabethkingia ursingii]OPC06986.1 hypothetical protein BAS09_18290 [Elizabethkingia ursingii]